MEYVPGTCYYNTSYGADKDARFIQLDDYDTYQLYIIIIHIVRLTHVQHSLWMQCLTGAYMLQHRSWRAVAENKTLPV